MRRAIVILALLVGLNVRAQEVPTHGAGADGRPRVGLILGGGGARGGAHVGILQVLEELRVPVDYIVGTSIGSIIGGLYASGMPPDEMQARIERIDWSYILSDKPERSQLSYRRKQDDWFNYTDLELGLAESTLRTPAGLTTAHRLNTLFQSLTLHTSTSLNFDDLPIPYRAMATDLETGEAVALKDGSLPRAMRASMAIPGAFTPVEWEGRLLIDGSISTNLPVDLIRDLGAEVLIVIDVSPELMDGPDVDWSLLGVGRQTVNILLADNTQQSIERLSEDDILLVAKFPIGLTEFEKMGEAITYGRAMAREISGELARLTVSEEAYAGFLKKQRRALIDPSTPLRIDGLEIDSGKRVPGNLVRRRLDVVEGESVSFNELEEGLARVYQIGEFGQVEFRLQTREGSNQLSVSAEEKDYGPNYLRFGLRIDGVYRSGTDFSFLLYHRRAFVNRLGAEWTNRLQIGDQTRLETGLYQPLTYGGFVFLEPTLVGFDVKSHIFPTDQRRDVLERRGWLARIDAGLQITNLIQLRGGVRGGKEWTERQSIIGSEESHNVAEWVLALELDHLDATGFPTSGGFVYAQTVLSREGIGADEDYDRVWGRGVLAGSLGAATLTATGELGTSFASVLPVRNEFRAGGFGRLSGLENGERSGGAIALGTLGLYYRVGSVPEVLGGGIYAGLTGETGNAWASQDDVKIDDLLLSGSVFVGIETMLGPVYTAFGFAEGGRDAWYFILGPYLSMPNRI